MCSLGEYVFDKKPDGEDIVEKICGSLKYTTTIGATIGVQNALFGNTSNSTIYKLVVGLRPTLYLTGIGFVFGTVTYMCGRYREKDDGFNMSIGALATAPLVKAWLRLPAVEIADVVIHASVYMAFLKMWRKYNKELNGDTHTFDYVKKGIRARLPNWDYWDYWTGELTPLEDYSN